jgi:hypothetical protein
MNEPLDELYLVWLYSRVANTRLKSPSRTYWDLLRKLFTTEFVWFVPNDDARVDDGRDLRIEFLQDAEIPEVDPHWMDQGCSYLELLIGISRRMAFMIDGEPGVLFWELIRNIGLIECTDAYNGDLDDLIEEVTDQITFRTYDIDGTGGLFPLRRSMEDQTKVELWYQMCAYVIENS